MRNDLVAIIELVLTMMTVYIVDWRLEKKSIAIIEDTCTYNQHIHLCTIIVHFCNILCTLPAHALIYTK